MNPGKHLFVPLVLGACLFFTSGCISTHLVKRKAKPHREFDVEQGRYNQVEGHAGYYAYLPLTVAGDILTSPFQVLYLIVAFGTGGGWVDVDGWPIPLP